jgi:hypothetical protein
LNVQEKINALNHILNFKNLKIFADNITNGNLDRAKGLSSGRIKKFNANELKILINDFNINENWLLDIEENIFKNNIENNLVKLNIFNNENKITGSFYFDKQFLNISESNFFLLKEFEDFNNCIYLLCKKITPIDIRDNNNFVFLKNGKLIIKKLTSEQDKHYVYAKIEKKISINSLID